MPKLELTEEERQALVNLLTVEIETSRFPLSLRIEALKRIRAKLRGDEVLPDKPKRRPRSRSATD
jgi:hypothetical protein